MPSAKHNCPKCQAPMEPGVIVDVADKRPVQESVVQPNWVAFSDGEIETTTWPPGYIKNLVGRDRRVVMSYRCVGCNYLESYAGPSIRS